MEKEKLFNFLYKILELNFAYAFIQFVGRPTVQVFKKHISQIPKEPNKTYLDVGCGIGGYRSLFPNNYTGIDINQSYIDYAKHTYPGDFFVMDCTNLKFPDSTFDHVVTVATSHHLNPQDLILMLSEALRVLKDDGHLHIIDAVLPRSKFSWGKILWFKLDRGGHPRTLQALCKLVKKRGCITSKITLRSALHETCYLQISSSKANNKKR